MKKKIYAVMIAILIILSLISCKKSNTETSNVKQEEGMKTIFEADEENAKPEKKADRKEQRVERRTGIYSVINKAKDRLLKEYDVSAVEQVLEAYIINENEMLQKEYSLDDDFQKNMRVLTIEDLIEFENGVLAVAGIQDEMWSNTKLYYIKDEKIVSVAEGTWAINYTSLDGTYVFFGVPYYENDLRANSIEFFDGENRMTLDIDEDRSAFILEYDVFSPKEINYKTTDETFSAIKTFRSDEWNFSPMIEVDVLNKAPELFLKGDIIDFVRAELNAYAKFGDEIETEIKTVFGSPNNMITQYTPNSRKLELFTTGDIQAVYCANESDKEKSRLSYFDLEEVPIIDENIIELKDSTGVYHYIVLLSKDDVTYRFSFTVSVENL